MRVLIVHNRYQYAGGEDAVVRDELMLLERSGVRVELYERHNDEIQDIPRLNLAADTVWSRRTVAEVTDLIRRFQPDVMHAHNIFPLVSPSVYYAASRQRVALVQTLHNFRLICAQAMFLRNGRVCEDCLGTLPWRAVVHRCYRESAAQSAVMVSMLGIHRALGSYRKRVTRYIALNRFCRDKFIQGGLPAERIAIKPNFVDLPAPERHPRSGALFVGRLSTEKGVAVLAKAAAMRPEARIDVIGTGPDHFPLQTVSGLRLLGWQTPPEIYERMAWASYLLMPSIWYENFPRTLVEAFALGLPVIASRLGALADLIRDGETGLMFEAGNAQDLAVKMAWADQHPEEMRRMGDAARREYEQKYTPETNFTQLMAIYRDALVSVRGEPQALCA